MNIYSAELSQSGYNSLLDNYYNTYYSDVTQDPDGAIKGFQECLESYPNSHLCEYGLAVGNMVKNNFDKCIDHINNIIEQDIVFDELFLTKAQCLFFKNEYRKALTEINYLLYKTSNTSLKEEALDMRIQINFTINNPKDILSDCFNTGFDLCQTGRNRLYRAISYVDIESNIIGIELLNQYIDEEEESDMAYVYRAKAKLKVSDYWGAYEDAAKCIEVTDSYALAYMIKGKAALKMATIMNDEDYYYEALTLFDRAGALGHEGAYGFLETVENILNIKHGLDGWNH
ncbi:MAG: hypothetical protein OCD01_05170 [Fibrobacterales bacterium]